MIKTTNFAYAALFSFVSASFPAAADIGGSSAADIAIERSGGPLPSPGYARPPFHITRNASAGPIGLSPAQVANFYGFNGISNQGEGQTIGIIDAYDDPNIESDLGVFSNAFGLPSCTSQNGCFKKIYAGRKKPPTNAGWSLEMALDVEWAHAIAPKAKIILVEAASNKLSDLMRAVDVAVSNGAKIVSMSFGGSEFSSETNYDSHFNVPGVTFTASSGDGGNGVEYPAASPYVVSVGGTTMSTDSTGTYLGETAWSGSGGGQSTYESEPVYQTTYPIPFGYNRGVPDVAYGADPNTGFAIYSSVTYYGQSGWFQVGGTSAGAPQWAALFAIANSSRVASGKNVISGTDTAVYKAATSAYGADFHDILTGTNGICTPLCTATPGYDYVTGLGSLVAPNLVSTFVSQ